VAKQKQIARRTTQKRNKNCKHTIQGQNTNAINKNTRNEHNTIKEKNRTNKEQKENKQT